MTTLPIPTSILITGASSGIGEALALTLARPGVRLVLGGRHEERLALTAATCRSRGAATETRLVDVSDAAAMAAWIADSDDRQPLDLVIANAGISAGTGGDGSGAETAAQVRRIFAVNIDGVVNTVCPAAERMTAHGTGQIAIVSSVAGFRGLPSAPAYAASKAAVKVWGEGLRGSLARHGVSVSVILPGFVESRMTAVNTFKMPFLMSAEDAAAIILRRLARGQGRIAFPWPTLFVCWLAAALPNALVDRLTRQLPGK